MANRRERFVRRVRKYLKEYCKCTSIHGFRYFGERRTAFERAWWIIVFVICLSGCAYFISLVYIKWENSPVIVSFSTKETPIYKIPFPAVTICPELKTGDEDYSHSEVVAKLLYEKNLTLKEYKYVSYMNLICDFNLSTELSRENELYNSTFNNYYYEDDKFFEFLNDVVLPPKLFYIKCRWMNQDIKCMDHLQPILTDEGICYTFNMLDHVQIYSDDVIRQNLKYSYADIPQNVTWNLDDGFKDNDGVNTYPKRALLSGVKNAFEIYLVDNGKIDDSTCKLSVRGFKIALHIPSRIPRLSQQHFKVSNNKAVLVAVQPVMITTSETVKVFTPQKRECYFQNEKSLNYFKHYTQHNCELACLTDFTLYWCDCVNFFMPRINGTAVCGALNKDCMEEAEKLLQQGNLNNILGKKLRRKNSTGLYIDEDEEIPDCGCYPLCTDLSYNIELSTARWDWRNVFKALNESNEIIDDLEMSLSRLSIYFKNSQFVTSKRHELYGPTEFLGNFGGLLGLFTGFSILSLMEIIYFLTVRIFCNIRLYGSWSGNEN